MKTPIFVLTLIAIASTSFADPLNSRNVVLFDRKDIYNCGAVMDPEKALQLKNRGWFTSVTGRCNPKPNPFRICGMGGEKMQNPKNIHESLVTTDSCQTDELKIMGWIQVRN